MCVNGRIPTPNIEAGRQRWVTRLFASTLLTLAASVRQRARGHSQFLERCSSVGRLHRSGADHVRLKPSDDARLIFCREPLRSRYKTGCFAVAKKKG